MLNIKCLVLFLFNYFKMSGKLDFKLYYLIFIYVYCVIVI